MPNRDAPHLLTAAALALTLALAATASACSGSRANRAPPSPDAGVFAPTPFSPPGGFPTPLPTVALPASRAEAVHFIDAAHGWVLQEAADDRGARVVMATDDGGTTWRQLARLPYALDKLDFADAMHGWAAGDGTELLATADGGVSWSVVREVAGELVRGIELVTPATGWVVSTAGVVRTDDGGVTWADVAPPCLNEPHGKRLLSFATAAEGLFVCTSGGGAGLERKTLYATHDGGATWTEVPEAIGSAGYLNAIGDAENGIAWYSTEQPGVALFVSHDSGANWAVAPRRGPAGEARNLLEAGPPIVSITSAQFIDAAHGWLVAATDAASGPGTVLATSDGGETWTPVVMP
jgi:photosystem II stability/assembly factor-like uncharacterized protein